MHRRTEDFLLCRIPLNTFKKLLITETDDLYMLQASAMPLTDKIQAPYFLL